ncbi:LOW QUALITY PROTEIN: polyglutamine-binding protein 1-like [Uloborus diversus]|uniref:LOW QUALITY PROTEIN: polyglutamine-binding protein 1-like n=1 Tax=Uloborus diversus TaxID=327109 RepID=UPI0024090230|nr:LOW QUALITY PROTEIN: polyglutamine-binding protein 1-like [Uloborus diversus]
MPLPQALLARLQKRGIVKAAEPEIEEEVIAEDYDDNEKEEYVPQNGVVHEDFSELKEAWIGCPNKWNIYHDCTKYCKDAWGSGKELPSPKTERKRLLMLKKYPLPDGWEEIYDPGIGRHYYWNTKTNEVSWLSPKHPRSKVSLPAEKLRALIKENFLEPMEEGEDLDQSDSEDESEDEENERTNEEKERHDRHARREHAREHARSRGRPKVRENDLDPMDPAAYSEAPRGTWSSGLDRKGEAKTGADTTASGPLYQMRPYPSPGAVLRLKCRDQEQR